MNYHLSELRRVAASLVTASMLFTASFASAQANLINWGNTGVGDWNVGANWPQFGAVPQADLFNEQGVIDNGGTAFVAGVVPNVGGVTLGGATLGGSLEVRSGGALSVVNNGTTSGTIQVGVANVAGSLAVQRGGSLNTFRLSTASTIGTVDIGGGSGAGAATVNATASFLRAPTRLRRNASFTTGQLELGGISNLITEIDSTGNAVLNVTGAARLNGSLSLEFTGVTPTTSSSWNIIQAGSFAGAVGNVTSPTALSPGLRYVSQIVPSGPNQMLQVTVEEVLTLQVNRTTGAATLVSESGLPVVMTGYNMASGSNRILTGYNSLQDQGLGGFQESGAGFSAGRAVELSPTGGLSISNGTVALGTPYNNTIFPAFGTAITDDLSFFYTRDDGRTFNANVTYSSPAPANTLVLTIDPATGNARLTNDSITALSLDAYSIGSTSGALRTTWLSLTDGGAAGWQEANPSVNRVSELNPSGSSSLAAGASLNLNGLWNTASPQNVADLSLNFNDNTLGEFTGVVRFGSLVASLPGDANSDGKVDLLDLDILGANFGLATGATLSQGDFNADGAVNLLDLDILGGNFGAMAASGTAIAVPEPSGLFTAFWALLAGCFARRRRATDGLFGRLQPQVPAMASRTIVAGVVLLAAGVAAEAQTSITGAQTAGLATPFTNGSITITPLDVNGSPVAFGPSTTYIGPLGNGNDNAINDTDGLPTTTADRDSMTIQLVAGQALTEFRWGFTRANPVQISGFGADPLAGFFANPGGGNNVLSYNNGTLSIFQNSFVGTETVIRLANAAASDGRTLTASVTDFFQAGPQLAFTGFTHSASTALLAPGDVDGLNGVTLDDFNIIKTNFFGTGPFSRSQGDLSGDGAVSLTDFALWETNFPGSSTGLAQLLVGVPEPSSAVLLLAGLATAGRRRRVC